MPRLEEISKAVDPEKEVLLQEDRYVWVVNKKDGSLKRTFVRIDNARGYREIHIEDLIKRIADRLKDSVKAKSLIRQLFEEILFKLPPEEIIEIGERLEKPEVSIKPAPRCLALMIGGKVGRPKEFVLVT